MGIAMSEIKTLEELKKRVLDLEKIELELKKTETLLQDELNCRRLLIEESRDAIVILDQDVKVYDANSRFSEMLGYSKEEVVQLHAWDWDAVLEKEQILELAKSVGPVGHHFETKHRRKDDRIIDVELSNSGTVYRGQKLIFCICRDITARKQAEEALRRSTLKLRLITDNIRDTVWLMDLNLKTTWISRSDFRTRGYTLQELTDMPLERHLTPDSFEKLMKVIAAEMTPERLADPSADISVAAELEFYRKDGSTFWGEITASLLRNGTGAPVGILGVGREITDRKQAEAALKQSEEKYRFLAEQMADIVWTVDLGLQVTYVSPSVKKILGFNSDEQKFRSIENLITPESLHRVLHRLKEELQKDGEPTTDPDRSITIEVEYYRKDGSTLWMENCVKAMRDPAGTIIGFIGVSRDISERKQAEEEKRKLEERLQRAEKMEAIGILAGGVAHDLNNVLGIIVGYAEMALYDLVPTSPLRPDLESIMEGGQKAAAIVQDMLTLARRGITDRKVVNLNEIISDCQFSPEFKGLSTFHPGLIVKIVLDPDLLNIAGSAVHLGKTLFNLISNAAEAMPKGGTVTIKTNNLYLDQPIRGYDEAREGDYVVLSVSDTGEGIAARDLKRIFEPFYTNKVMGRSGTGLGLAEVWGTVKDHSGYIDVTSEEGKGSTFTLYFPVTREEPVAGNKPVALDEYTGRGESLLIIDDVKGQRELAEQMLKKLNYRVSAVPSGEAAVNFLKDQQVDLLVLDMIMDPGMDGLDTYRKILQIHPRQKAVIVSGFSESERVRAAQALGAGPYVKKPYVLEKLGLAVRRELDREGG
jgi:PAS domain S-box-containing protein